MVKIRRVLQAPIARDRNGAAKMEFRKEMKKAGYPMNAKTYRDYQKSREIKRPEDIREFLRGLEEEKKRIKSLVDAWPNPLMNGRKGKRYECSFRLPQYVDRATFEGLKDVGLERIFGSDARSITISGVPDKAGDFKIRMYYTWPGLGILNPVEIAKICLLRELDLSIFPDPRDLWNDIPTPLGIQYYKKDEVAVSKTFESLIMVGASVRGRSHAHTGLPRDDDFALASVNGWQILMVADGAGSAPYSRAGSNIACDTVARFCENYLGSDNELSRILENIAPGQDKADWYPAAKRAAYALAPQAVFNAYKEIKGEAGKYDRDPKEYATTALLAICREFPAGWFVISFQVGDGAMALFSDGRAKLLAEPDEGEYGGQTRFITMKEIYQPDEMMRRLNIDLVPRLDALTLMTDGVSDAKFSTLANLRDETRWIALWDELKPLVHSADAGGELKAWLGFWSEGNHDDRTLAILSRREAVIVEEHPGAEII